MIDDSIKTLLIACIALLQCFLPLVHAHAYEAGHDSRHAHVHLHVFNLDTGVQEPHSESELKASTSLPGTVGVASEYKRELSLLPIVAANGVIFPVAVRQGWHPAFPAVRGLPARSLYRANPPATAPPSQSA
jgi:hypothetical protein